MRNIKTKMELEGKDISFIHSEYSTVDYLLLDKENNTIFYCLAHSKERPYSCGNSSTEIFQKDLSKGKKVSFSEGDQIFVTEEVKIENSETIIIEWIWSPGVYDLKNPV